MPRKVKRNDYADRETEEMLSELEKKISKEYKQASDEVAQKYEDFIAGSAEREVFKKKQLQSGEISEAEFIRWKQGQVFIGKRWKNMSEELAEDLVKADKKALSIANGYMPEAYALNHNYATYEIEKGLSVDTSYTLYSRESVERLLRNDPSLLPKRKVDVPKDKKWNQQHLNSAVTQGILQGDDLKSISKRLRNVSDMDKTAALRNARTMMTGAQNAGRIDAMLRMKALGINVKKEWIATLDNHTRATHGALDGEIQEVEDNFSNGLLYPGDPQGKPAEVYNCRCTLGYSFPDYEDDEPAERYDNLNRKVIKGTTYKEWAKKKPVDVISPIHKIVNGKDISAIWKRREDEYNFEIEDVINAQGFDGLPRVVSEEEFNELVKQANGGEGFIAQRTYSAPDQETLDAYRDQLYRGKWYVDCSTGGAQYGQGMYCAADYTGTLSSGIRAEMEHYQEVGEARVKTNISAERYKAIKNAGNNLTEALRLSNMSDEEFAKEFGIPSKSVSYTETITLDPSAKIITWRELQDIRNGNLDVVEFRKEVVGRELSSMNLSDNEKIFIKYNITGDVSWEEADKAAKELGKDGRSSSMDIVRKLGNKVTDETEKEQNKRSEMARFFQEKYKDPGSMAAGLGYDAINAEGHGESGSYTVVLNRTKLIIKGE